eukprot:8441116-Pyramimonas_sp.AAC.1
MSGRKQEVFSLDAKTRNADEPVPPPLPDFTISFLNYVREQCRPLLAEDEREEGIPLHVSEPIDLPSTSAGYPCNETGQRRASFASQQ